MTFLSSRSRGLAIPALLAVVLLLVSSTPARADDGRDAPAPPTRSHWYGWQTLGVDALAGVFVPAMALATDARALNLVAAGGYFLGAPAIHFAHDRPWHALGSLGLRATTPLLGAGIGEAIASANCDGRGLCGIGAGTVGAIIGAGAAVAIDAAFLAHERVADEPTAAAAAGVHWSALAAPRKEGGFDVGVGGTF